MGYRNTKPHTILAVAALLVASIASCGAPGTSEGPASSAEQSSRSWATYVTPDGALRFEHPEDWVVAEEAPLANDPAGGVSLQITNGSGRVLARLDTGIITDLVCTPPAEPVTYIEYDSEPMPALRSAQATEQRFVYRSVGPAPGREPQATYAVVSGKQDDGQCGLFDFFSLTESGGGRFAGEYPGNRSAGNEEYLDGAAGYGDSQEYRDLKRMLTSLRN